MSVISKTTSLAELGAIVCDELKKAGVDVFLSGGAVVSIYTNNKYESLDLDFVSLADRSKIKRIMENLGFEQNKSRLYEHPRSKFLVEFPGSAVTVGESLITEFNQIKIKKRTLKLLTPTDCVKDRLAAFYHWNDRQGLDQAIWVAQAQPVKIEEVKKWSIRENKLKEFQEFERGIKA